MLYACPVLCVCRFQLVVERNIPPTPPMYTYGPRVAQNGRFLDTFCVTAFCDVFCDTGRGVGGIRIGPPSLSPSLRNAMLDLGTVGGNWPVLQCGMQAALVRASAIAGGKAACVYWFNIWGHGQRG